MTLLAVRLIDLAIFGSLGGLWIGGAIFIVVLYRWILRFERGDGSSASAGEPMAAASRAARAQAAHVHPRACAAVPPATAAREALASHG